MKLETSICIDENVKNEILKFSEKSGKSACYLVNNLIKKAIRINDNIVINNKLVEYQESSPSFCKQVFRYRVTSSEHKYYNAARARMEISISKLLLVGFLLFFKELVSTLKKCKTKIQWYNYTAIQILLFPTIEEFIKSIGYEVKKE